MIIFHSETTKARRARTELNDGRLVTPFECPERVDLVLSRLRALGLGEVCEPGDFGLAPVLAVHDRDYVDFLARCWGDWQAAGTAGEAIPNVWPARTMRGDRIPEHVEGRLGYYALAAETSICAGTFEAAMASKDVALAALEHTLATGEPSFGLCRPPGHHAASDQFGGYCFFNNAAIAAQRALERALARIRAADCELLIVSLGVDTFEGDPISAFKLTSDDFTEVGRRLASLGLPSVFLMEGGYAVEEIGINVGNVLGGFERGEASG